jgi:hypothetical protein
MDKAAEGAVLGAVGNNPHISTQQTENYSKICKASVHGILKCQKFHSYHITYIKNYVGMIFKIM